jgi:hypothetical protein
MTIIRPRLIDHFDLSFTQEEADFAIPFLDEDLPLYVDPFLLWKSPSQQDNALHTAVVNSVNFLGYLSKKGKEIEAVNLIVAASECEEVGLGLSRTKTGKRISEKTALSILNLYNRIPQVNKNGFVHFEEIQLLVENIAEDRISDLTCSFLKSFLIDYTVEQCEKHRIPLAKVTLTGIFDYKKKAFFDEQVVLPHHPETFAPMLFVPKRWLRFTPWINYEDYYKNHFVKNIDEKYDRINNRIAVLNFNRKNYDLVSNYVAARERVQSDCKNDPLFKSIPIHSAKSKLSQILSIPTGKSDNADKRYEDTITQLMASVLYPQLDFADEQSRTDSGVLIRDLIFYNTRSVDFLKEIYKDFGAKQIVMELKNVKQIEREHINQLNRYLNDQFGSFGIIITRNLLPEKIVKNTIDLWAGQRKCIIALTDNDIKLMVSVFESKQRQPIEVINRAYVEFMRKCPS